MTCAGSAVQLATRPAHVMFKSKMGSILSIPMGLIVLDALGALWGRCWLLWGRSWGALGASWGALGALLDALGALLKYLGALLGRSWGTLGRILGRLGSILGEISKNINCHLFFAAILGPKMKAKIIENRMS